MDVKVSQGINVFLVKLWLRISILGLCIHSVVISPISKCIIQIDILGIRNKSWPVELKNIIVGNAKWKPMKLLHPHT